MWVDDLRMIYRISHRTTYKYAYPVSVGDHVAFLKPRSLPRNQLLLNTLEIRPTPTTFTERIDYFGNVLCFFTVQEPHKELIVEAKSEVVVNGSADLTAPFSLPWEESSRSLALDHSPEGLEAYQFQFESPRIRLRPEFAAYALQSFTPRRPIREALIDLTARIHRDFRFDARVTTVRTPTEEVFKKRRGVCQDFAHLQIACLRALGLSARYVSGYLYDPELMGDNAASHAWVDTWDERAGWVALDPTHGREQTESYVRVAVGRDYAGVPPTRGVYTGLASETLSVRVGLQAL